MDGPGKLQARGSRAAGVVEKHRKGFRQVRYVIERMTMADVPRVIEIEKLAYPATWPASAYRKELQENRWAHYIVLRDKMLMRPLEMVNPESDRPRRPFPLSLFATRPGVPATLPNQSSIVGFAGLWLMVDEAHITTIATHPDYRGMHLGELLLSSLIDIAYQIEARWVTLEVRVSNHVAQNLYRKYGFREAGVRPRYYSDNQEDALIMWTEEIASPSYKQRYQELKKKLYQALETQDEPHARSGD
jgi:ribosomal-protein-alanine N-acetyltransferase